jgi:hypothetical protein
MGIVRVANETLASLIPTEQDKSNTDKQRNLAVGYDEIGEVPQAVRPFPISGLPTFSRTAACGSAVVAWNGRQTRLGNPEKTWPPEMNSGIRSENNDQLQCDAISIRSFRLSRSNDQ